MIHNYARFAAVTLPLLLAGRLCGAAVPLQNATATLSQSGGWNVGTAIDGVVNADVGWAVFDFAAGQARAATAVFETVTDVGFAEGSLFTFQLSQINHNPQHTIGRFRLSVTTDNRDNFADGLANGGSVNANWIVLKPFSVVATGGTEFEILNDDSILAAGSNPDTSVYSITATTSLEHITGIRLEVLQDPSLPLTGPGRYPSNGNFVLSEFEMDIVPVPEPSIALLLLPCAFFGFLIWKRRKERAVDLRSSV
jgi:hypothetical protein